MRDVKTTKGLGEPLKSNGEALKGDEGTSNGDGVR